MSVNDLEQFRLQVYTKAQADLARKIRNLLEKGDMVDVMELLREVEEKGGEVGK